LYYCPKAKKKKKKKKKKRKNNNIFDHFSLIVYSLIFFFYYIILFFKDKEYESCTDNTVLTRKQQFCSGSILNPFYDCQEGLCTLDTGNGGCLFKYKINISYIYIHKRSYN